MFFLGIGLVDVCGIGVFEIICTPVRRAFQDGRTVSVQEADK
jgi:hypothetical protein